jgi:hypothetical protein
MWSPCFTEDEDGTFERNPSGGASDSRLIERARRQSTEEDARSNWRSFSFRSGSKLTDPSGKMAAMARLREVRKCRPALYSWRLIRNAP